MQSFPYSVYGYIGSQGFCIVSRTGKFDVALNMFNRASNSIYDLVILFNDNAESTDGVYLKWSAQ